MQRMSIKHHKSSLPAQKPSNTGYSNAQYKAGNISGTANQQPCELALASRKDTDSFGTSSSGISYVSFLEQNTFAELSEDELYDKFQTDGPVLADHSEKTKKAKFQKRLSGSCKKTPRNVTT